MVQLQDRTADQLLTLPGTWEGFKLVRQGLQDSPGARLAFYEGVIEILMPGEAHELFAHMIGYFVTTFLAEKGTLFVPTRSKDQEREGVAAVQADESYCLGRAKPIPDLSIEVVFTSGGVDKLARYLALSVPEVWFWQDGTLELYHLQADGYQRIERSGLPGLEDLDMELLKRCLLIAETDTVEAIRVFRSAISQS